VLQRDGWRIHRVTGSHHHLIHPQKPGLVTVPVHAGKIIKPKTLKGILDQAGISMDTARELL